MARLIDRTSTFVAIGVVALLLFAGVSFLVLAQPEQPKPDALQAIADRAARLLDGISSMTVETAARMSLGAGGSVELPELADGHTYSLTLYSSQIVAGFEGRRGVAALHAPLHLWEPRAGGYTASSVTDLDTLHPSLTLQSGGAAIVSRRYLTVDGQTALETFAFS